MTAPEWSEWDAQLAIAQLYRYRNGNIAIPSCSTFGYEMDVAIITPAHYLYEIEIKRTLSDWKADEHKDKWGRSRSEISKFYYAIPPELVDKKPEFVDERTGIIIIHKNMNPQSPFKCFAEIHKEAKRINSNKIDTKRPYMMGIFYHRYWDLRWNVTVSGKEVQMQQFPPDEPIERMSEKMAFSVLPDNCPVCGDRLIENNRGIECGAMRCNYEQGKSA